MDIQSANKQHPVPQNVMDVEFKLIGELTIRQFSYLLVFAVMSFIVAKTAIPIIFKYPLIGILVLAGLAFAFLPFNDITLDKWVSNYIRAVTNPRLRVWKHVQRIPYYFTLDAKKQESKKGATNNYYHKKRGSIDDFLNKNKPNNIAFNDDADIKANENEFFAKLGLKQPEIITKPQDQFKPKIRTEVKVEDIINKNIHKELFEDETHTKGKYTSLALDQSIPVLKSKISNNIQESTKKETNISSQKTENTQDYQLHLKELDALKQKLLKDIEKNKFKLREDKKTEIQNLNTITKTSNPFNKNLNTTTVAPTTQPKIQQHVIAPKQKIKSVEKPKVKKEKRQHTGVENVNISKQPKTGLFKSLFGMLGSDNNGLKVQQTKKPYKEKENPTNNNSVKPNMLKGSTKDMHENIIQNTIVIIKNSDNDPVRALKTNALGEFEVSTPLENGLYKIEAIKEGFSFTPIEVKALGQVINPVKLVGSQVTVLS